jgi:hypothetical protein
MTATYTFDVFATLDGFGSYNSSGDWGGYWAGRVPSSSAAASPSTARSSGWSSGPPPSATSCTSSARPPRSLR